MQLTSPAEPKSRLPELPVRVLLALLCCVFSSSATAQNSVDATTTIFYEKGGPLDITVINPSVKANADVVDALAVHAGWQADVVSGASVAVVDAPGGSSVDAVTSRHHAQRSAAGGERGPDSAQRSGTARRQLRLRLRKGLHVPRLLHDCG